MFKKCHIILFRLEQNDIQLVRLLLDPNYEINSEEGKGSTPGHGQLIKKPSRQIFMLGQERLQKKNDDKQKDGSTNEAANSNLIVNGNKLQLYTLVAYDIKLESEYVEILFILNTTVLVLQFLLVLCLPHYYKLNSLR